MLLLSWQTPHILFAIVLSDEEKIYKNSDNFQKNACNSLDFIVYKAYAYDMKKNKKIQITKVPFESIDNTYQKCQEIFSEDVIVVISTHINNLFE